MTTFSDNLKNNGVVGFGGAGFPTYVKANAKAEIVIVNAAECEPLLAKDIEILTHYTDMVLDGLTMLAQAVGAKKAVIALKRKHSSVVKLLEQKIKERPLVSLHLLGDFYPAGDEYVTVYEVTKKLIPAGGIPLDVGAVVNNVETVYNIARNKPVTDTILTVCGAVKKPVTVKLPVGVSYKEALELAGGAMVEDFAVIEGGPMMGTVTDDLSKPLVKASAGLIVLPKTHHLIRKKAMPKNMYAKQGKSACDQCSYCTMLCPRYLMGYNIVPHKVMRGLIFSGPNKTNANQWALLCCECNLCSFYSCPENLDPRNVCVSAKAELKDKGINIKNSDIIKIKSLGAVSTREYRKTPISMLVKKLGLAQYKKPAPFVKTNFKPGSVKIMLNQHIGVPAQAVVNKGVKVKRGDVIATVPNDKLGVNIHASVCGTVQEINQFFIVIKAD